MAKYELLKDIQGVNKAGEKVYPYKFISGKNKGKYVASLNSSSDPKYRKGYTEQELRELIASGSFKNGGLISMCTEEDQNPKGNGFKPKKYKGISLVSMS